MRSGHNVSPLFQSKTPMKPCVSVFQLKHGWARLMHRIDQICQDLPCFRCFVVFLVRFSHETVCFNVSGGSLDRQPARGGYAPARAVGACFN